MASQDNPSFPSTEISNLVAINSTHSSSATASNYSSSPSPILNSPNPTNVDVDTSSISPSSDPDHTSLTDIDINTSSISPSLDPDNTSPNPIIQPTFTHIQTRSKTGHSRPKSFPDYKLFYHTQHPLRAFSAVFTTTEPTSYTQAILDPKRRAAMEKEFDALMINGTWSLCPRPLDKHIVRNKWVYKVKRRPDGNIECFKAILMAKGYDQRSGADYHETFSPVIKPTSIRLILAITVHFHWPIR